MKLENAGIKSKKEAAQRLLDGEVFYSVNEEICFNSDNGFPFKIDNANLTASWACFKEWQIEVPHRWEDDLKDGAILCWVSDDYENPDRENHDVCEIISSKNVVYIGSLPWKYATPIKPSECYQGEEDAKS